MEEKGEKGKRKRRPKPSLKMCGLKLVAKGYSASWANANASAAVDAGISVYNSFSIRKSDSASWASSFASSASDAHIVINNSSHLRISFRHQLFSL